MAFLAVGALSAAGGLLGSQLLRRRPDNSSTSAMSPAAGRACASPKAPPRSDDAAEHETHARDAAAGVLAALPPWRGPNEGDSALSWSASAPPQSLWEAQVQMHRFTQVLAAQQAEMQAATLVAALRRSLTQDAAGAGERGGGPAPAMHLCVNVNSSSETTAAPPAPLAAADAAGAALKATAGQCCSWQDALLRAALRALATIALYETGKAAARRRSQRSGPTGLQMLSKAAMRTAHASPLRSVLGNKSRQSDSGSTHKWGFIVL